ncbi:HEAT repeat domain-containing protein [Marinicella rhabdoformis]|uniref:HEAT repeat domain-containing protein n=1 Tax=Marinicella rhabdoformis TaxID=2580566 RepID=UPI0012AEB921|nr:HEAT repeat domain-containing protein [Marinicella rhabdoformis]
MKSIRSYLVAGMMAAVNMASDALNIENITGQSLTQYVEGNKKESQWIGYQVVAAENTTSMCCWDEGLKDGESAVCDLSDLTGSYGSSSQNGLTENIRVFVNLKQGQAQKIIPMGDACPVVAEGITVDWIEDVSNQESITWLAQQAEAKGDDNGSLYTLAMHQGQAAAYALSVLAKKQGEHANSAVFWLGQRHNDGVPFLKGLLSELPQGELRKSINFALSQNKQPEALEALYGIARNGADQSQQADAIFWLSQVQDKGEVVPFLMSILKDSDNKELSEKVIFSLSQLNMDVANNALFDILKGDYDREVKKKALFWLSQSDDDQVSEQLAALL